MSKRPKGIKVWDEDGVVWVETPRWTGSYEAFEADRDSVAGLLGEEILAIHEFAGVIYDMMEGHALRGDPRALRGQGPDRVPEAGPRGCGEVMRIHPVEEMMAHPPRGMEGWRRYRLEYGGANEGSVATGTIYLPPTLDVVRLIELVHERRAGELQAAIDRHVKRSAETTARIPPHLRTILSKSEAEHLDPGTDLVNEEEGS